MPLNRSFAACLVLPFVLAACSGSSDQDSVVVGDTNSSVEASPENSLNLEDGVEINNTAETDGNTTGDSSDVAGEDLVVGNTGSEDNPEGTNNGVIVDSNLTPDNENSVTTNDPATSDANGDFGLTARTSLASFNLPIEGERIGSFELVNGYPNLRQFNAALIVDDVPGEERLVVIEQAGKIKVFDDSPTVTESKEILDYTDQVTVESGEQGFLGLAFDPQFTQNRYVYTYHTQKGSNKSIISRFTWDATTDVIDRSSLKVILEADQPFLGHNGGMIAFGPDNYLYIAFGDGGDGGDPLNNAQDRSTLLGSVLRIDVHPQDPSVGYDIPPSNPFVNEAGVRGEIFAYGFRNPWRFSFDQATGDLWLGDVGQTGFEEVNIVKAGGNYGWREYEGSGVRQGQNPVTIAAADVTFPVHEYPNADGQSVVGGYVYRGSVSSLQGRYIFTDFSNGIVRALDWDGTSVSGLETLSQVTQPSSFGEDRNGELLVVTYDGRILKFVESSAGSSFPAQLSQTGLFDDLSSLTPANGIIEYTPSHPFWSDGTLKRRWIGVPDGSKIEFSDNDWIFPLGSVSIKHFELELTENTPSSARRLETRVMYHTQQGWQGVTYRWNDAQTEATLSRDQILQQFSVALNDGSTRDQTYEFLSQNSCASCHSEASTYLLGLETAQINTDFTFGSTTDNQLRSYNNINLFNVDVGDVSQYNVLPPLTDASASVGDRARAYLDVNCSVCHQPGGAAPTGIDLRYEVGNDALNAINVVPQTSSFGIADARIIAAGSQERSVLIHRMRALNESRMPPVSSHVVDEVAVELIGDWIDSM